MSVGGRDPSRHADALEAADNGDRLALAMERDLMAIVAEQGSVPEPLDAEAAAHISSKLLDARGAITAAALRVPLEGEGELHAWFSALLTGLDQIGAELVRRFES